MATRSYDVLVVGGGVAGVAAAIEAARGGLKTALVEKTILWGGLATSGTVPMYMPLCDGQGRQVTFGLAEELLYRAIQYGPGKVPPAWAARAEAYGTGSGDTPSAAPTEELYDGCDFQKRYQVTFTPQVPDPAQEESVVVVYCVRPVESAVLRDDAYAAFMESPATRSETRVPYILSTEQREAVEDAAIATAANDDGLGWE